MLAINRNECIGATGFVKTKIKFESNIFLAPYHIENISFRLNMRQIY